MDTIPSWLEHELNMLGLPKPPAHTPVHIPTPPAGPVAKPGEF